MARGPVPATALLLLLPVLASLENAGLGAPGGLEGQPRVSGAWTLEMDAQGCFGFRECALVAVWPHLRDGGEVVEGCGRCRSRRGPHVACPAWSRGSTVRGVGVRLRGGADESEVSGADQADDETVRYRVHCTLEPQSRARWRSPSLGKMRRVGWAGAGGA